MSRLRALTVSIAVLGTLATGGPAAAHGTGSHTGFVSTVSGIHPPQPGLIVSVYGGHEQLSIRNLTRGSVAILGENGEPVLRLEPGKAGALADPRIGSTGPPPEEGEFVKDWRIAGTADGTPFEIVGFLGYRPPPGATAGGDDGLPGWAIAVAVVGGTLVLGAALALPLWLRKDEGVPPATD
jgi:hypothetical protein